MMIEEGKLFTVANGEYSDYCVQELCKPLKTFNIKEVYKEWVEEFDLIEEDNEVDEYANKDKEYPSLIAYIKSKDLIEYVDYQEIHFGSYGRTSIGVY